MAYRFVRVRDLRFGRWWSLIVVLLLLMPSYRHEGPEAAECKPTQPDALGPFYKPGAPERSRVGDGYLLSGTVKSSSDCSPLAGARIEFWLAGPDGIYDDARRATVLSDKSGGYRFESNVPPPYAGRPPHIHVRVSAQGFRTLVTQHYPARGQREARFDLVLVPDR